jgi:hypothetical protein
MTDQPAPNPTREKDLLAAAAAFAPAACTLPTAERPLRTSEFIDLLGTQTLADQQIDDRHARFELNPDPEVAARTADLFTRETQCCSFFTFTLTATGGRLSLAVEVPSSQVTVLAALTAMAGAGTGR